MWTQQFNTQTTYNSKWKSYINSTQKSCWLHRAPELIRDRLTQSGKVTSPRFKLFFLEITVVVSSVSHPDCGHCMCENVFNAERHIQAPGQHMLPHRWCLCPVQTCPVMKMCETWWSANYCVLCWGGCRMETSIENRYHWDMCFNVKQRDNTQ